MVFSNTIKGTSLALLGACLWGAMGVAGQNLLNRYSFTPMDLVAVRLLAAGILFLFIKSFSMKLDLLRVLKDWRNLRDVFIAGVSIGISQFTFFMAIFYSNVGTTTVFLTLSPIFMLLYLALATHRTINRLEVLCMLTCMLGVSFLVTKGDFHSLNFSLKGLFWSFLSIVTFIFYTLQPKKVMARIGVSVTVAWAFFFGGIVFCLVNPPWTSHAVWSWGSVANFAFIVTFGTVIALWAFLASTRFISPAHSTMLTCAEPLTAVLLSWILLGVGMNLWEMAGAVLCVAGVTLLTAKGTRSAS